VGGISAGLGTTESPFVLDDDDMAVAPPAGRPPPAAAGGTGRPPYFPAGDVTPAGESSYKRVKDLGVGSAVSAVAPAPAVDASPRVAASSAAGTAPPPLSLTGVPVATGGGVGTPGGVVPFTGVGRTLKGSSGVSESKAGGSPSLSPGLTPAAGGVLLRPGSSAGKQRSLNRFEQLKAEQAFSGQGRSLR
jgi:hypothetical protein